MFSAELQTIYSCLELCQLTAYSEANANGANAVLCFVLSSSYQESDSKVTADGVVGLTRAFLAAGAQCVLVSLWPVPVAASKMFVHAFYTALLNGTKASAALADAMKTLQGSKQFSHPSNWAG